MAEGRGEVPVNIVHHEIGELTPSREVRLNNIEALGQGLLAAYLRAHEKTSGRKSQEGSGNLVTDLGRVVAEYKAKDFSRDGQPKVEIPEEAVALTSDLSSSQREKLWRDWCFRVGEQAVNPSDTEGLFGILSRATESLQKREEPELTPLTSGTVSWLGPVKGSITDPILESILKIYDSGTEDTTETKKDLMELVRDIRSDKTINPVEREKILDEIGSVLATQQPRLMTNEVKAATGGVYSAEYPKSAELLVDFVRLQLEELTELKDDPPPVGWASRLIVTQGGFVTHYLADPRFETSTLGKTPVSVTDAEGTRRFSLAEYLRKEVEAAEKVTREAYAYTIFKTDRGYDALSGNALGNDVFRNLGTIIDSSKLGSGKYLGDTIGACWDIYKQLAEGREITDKSGKPLFNQFTTSLSEADSYKEGQTRDYVRENFAGKSKYAEQLAYNLAIATGLSSEGNKKGTMSGTMHTSFIDRAFHLNTWRGMKEDKSGPEWTRNKSFYPERLMLDATEMTAIESEISMGGKRETIYRTIAGLLRDKNYRMRELTWSKLPQFQQKFLINMGDAFGAFKDITMFPDEVKSAETALRDVRDHIRNAWSENLFFWRSGKDASGKVVIQTIDGMRKSDVDRIWNKKEAVARAMRGWVEGELQECNRLKAFGARSRISGAAYALGMIRRTFF